MVLGLIRLIGLIGLIGGIGGRCLSGGFSERDREKFIEKQCRMFFYICVQIVLFCNSDR